MNPAATRDAACCELVSEIARTSSQVRLKLNGTSMIPAMWPGDVVAVSRCDASKLLPGHIVLYRGEGTLTAHRILRKSGDRLVLQGDSLPACDPPVRDSDVVGKVVGIVRGARSVSLQRSLPQRLVSPLLRRSELCTHIVLRVGSGPWTS